jgi:hypothetical protein
MEVTKNWKKLKYLYSSSNIIGAIKPERHNGRGI